MVELVAEVVVTAGDSAVGCAGSTSADPGIAVSSVGSSGWLYVVLSASFVTLVISISGASV